MHESDISHHAIRNIDHTIRNIDQKLSNIDFVWYRGHCDFCVNDFLFYIFIEAKPKKYDIFVHSFDN